MRRTDRLLASWLTTALALLVSTGDGARAAEPAADAGQRLTSVLEAAQRGGTDAVALLATAANDPDPWVRRAAILALGDRGSDAAERAVAAEALGRSLRASAAEDREVACVAAGNLGARELLEPLAEAANDQDPRVASQALGALAALRDVRALPALLGALQNPDGVLAQRAMSGLEALLRATPSDAVGAGSTAGAQPRTVATTPTPELLAAAVAPLAAVAADRARTQLLRQHAVLVLGLLATPAARTSLEALAASDDGPVAAQAALELSGARVQRARTDHDAQQPEERP